MNLTHIVLQENKFTGTLILGDDDHASTVGYYAGKADKVYYIAMDLKRRGC